jgi:hypothetical protein
MQHGASIREKSCVADEYSAGFSLFSRRDTGRKLAVNADVCALGGGMLYFI